MTREPMVSVRLMVYNNAPFIRKALDSILMQQTDFDYEIVIGDDFSTDGTRNILQEYHDAHPDKIRVLERPEGGTYFKDRKRHGRIHNFVDIVDHCRGKYVAILDGDDYWTDREKLQLQVDALEADPETALCFHQCREFSEDGTERFTNEDQPPVTDGAYLLQKGWHIRSASVIFRRSELPAWPDWVYTIESMDYVVQCMVTRKGRRIRYIDRCMCDYRIHPGNVSSKINRDYLEILIRNEHLLQCIRSIQERPDHIDIIDRRLKNNRTNQFYQLRARSGKTFDDWKRIIRLGFQLKKFTFGNLLSKISGRRSAKSGTGSMSSP